MDLGIVVVVVMVLNLREKELKKKGKDAWNLIFLPPSHERNNGERDPTPPSATSKKLQFPALISRRQIRSKRSPDLSRVSPYTPRSWD